MQKNEKIVQFPDTLFISFVFISSVLITALGFCFLLLKIPDHPSLLNYRTSRKMLAVSYFIMGIANALHLYIDKDFRNTKLVTCAILVIGAFQAFLFTYTLVTLIDRNFAKFRKVIFELSFLLLFLLPWVFSLAFGWLEAESWTYGIFNVYYLFLLVRYTFLFFRQERLYRIGTDHCSSDFEIKRLGWVRTAFLGALTIGILAFFAQLFPKSIFMGIFIVLYILYYFYFAIRYINYVPVFHPHEPVAATQEAFLDWDSGPEDQLTRRLEEWVSQKKYLSPGVTLGGLALEMNTNRTYFSTFINTRENMNFKAWINYLRIEEAKELLLRNPELSVGEIAQKMGYPDQSSFTRQFSKLQGMPPLLWRKQKVNI